MTQPDAQLRAEVTVDADIDDDMHRIMARAKTIADAESEDIGRAISEGTERGFADDIGPRLERTLREALDDMSDAARRAVDDRRSLVDLILERDRARRAGRRAGEAASGGFMDAFSNLGSVITGPLGAIFNVSGRSPVILLLLPVLGAIVSLITAAVYGLQALSSQLFVIPGLLFAIGLQAAALFLIFDNFATVAGEVFAAKNATELAAALKDVNKELADFVVQLLPWRDFFRNLQELAKTAFFGELDNELIQVLDNIRAPFSTAIQQISGGLGGVLADFLKAFTTPEFALFLELIGGSTLRWLEGFGPALNTFVDGLTDLGIAMMPFVELFGIEFNEFITEFGNWLSGLGEDPEFMKWMNDSIPVIRDFLELAGGAWDLLKEIIASFSEADQKMQEQGGRSFLDSLTFIIGELTRIMGSELGQEAMRGFIILIVGLTTAFIALAAAISALLALFAQLFDAFKIIADKVVELTTGGPAVALAQFIEKIGGWITAIKDGATTALTEFGGFVTGLVDKALGRLSEIADSVPTTFSEIKESVLTFLHDSGAWLLDAGEQLIKGFIRGIDKGVAGGLLGKLGNVAAQIRSFFPFSPAKQGPLAGHGDLKFAGQELIQRLVTGIEMETPMLTAATNSAAQTIAFGPGSVQVTYNGGTPPTQQQSMMMGQTAGRSIVEQLLNARLTVRTM